MARKITVYVDEAATLTEGKLLVADAGVTGIMQIRQQASDEAKADSATYGLVKRVSPITDSATTITLDNMGGSSDGTLAAIGDTTSTDQSAAIIGNFNELLNEVNELRTKLNELLTKKRNADQLGT